MAEIVNLKAHISHAAQAALETQQAAVTVLYSGSEGKILRPENKFAAAKLAQGTGWQIENAEGPAYNPKSEFEKIGEPVIIFIPAPHETPLTTQFRNNAAAYYRQWHDPQAVAAESAYKKTEQYYAANNSGFVYGPFTHCERVDPITSEPFYAPRYNYYGAEKSFSVKTKPPKSLMELALGAAMKDPQLGEYLFENLPLQLKWVPEKYRIASICKGALSRGEDFKGNKFDIFHYIPGAVRQDREFQDWAVAKFNGLVRHYHVLETANRPRTLIQLAPGNRDLMIEPPFSMKDGVQ